MSEFSDFIRYASDDEKKDVYSDVIDRATERQNKGQIMNTQRAAELIKVAAEYIRDEETCPWPTLVYDGGERTAMELAMDLERVAVELERETGEMR